MANIDYETHWNHYVKVDESGGEAVIKLSHRSQDIYIPIHSSYRYKRHVFNVVFGFSEDFTDYLIERINKLKEEDNG